jgi:hypothetical protein
MDRDDKVRLWLYQMNHEKFPVWRYRAEIWEGVDIQNWGFGKIKAFTPETLPNIGDTMILFYVKSRQADPGIYGWGVILQWYETEMNFRLSTPSDYLKMNPLWDKDIDKTINDLCGVMRRATLFEDRSGLLGHLRDRIAEHVYGRTTGE